jgi:aryl-alcohol dehydrogenase-like predicted oxidoreductase
MTRLAALRVGTSGACGIDQCVPQPMCIFSPSQVTAPVAPFSRKAGIYTCHMETRALGPSDLQVSVFGLGTMTFGAESDEATSHGILDRYHEAGGRFIDTADVYSRGVSEEIIGRWLASTGKREEMVLATKARFSMGEGSEMRGAGADYLGRAVDASLGRLGTDVIDLYQMHAWDPDVPIEETLGALNSFVDAGKVRYIGVSNYTGWQIERTVLTAQRNGWAAPVSLQPQYNLLARDIELEVMPASIENGLGLLPWSPLGGGWLTGKYSRESRPSGATRLGEDPDRGVEAYDRRNTERVWSILAQVDRVASQHGVTMSQVSLNWVRNRPSVSSVLLGVRTVDQLEDNLGALEWDLDDSEIEDLTRISAPGIPDYVQGFLDDLAGVDIWRRLGTTFR